MSDELRECPFWWPELPPEYEGEKPKTIETTMNLWENLGDAKEDYKPLAEWAVRHGYHRPTEDRLRAELAEANKHLIDITQQVKEQATELERVRGIARDAYREGFAFGRTHLCPLTLEEAIEKEQINWDVSGSKKALAGKEQDEKESTK